MIKVGIQFQLPILPLSNTEQNINRLGVKRNRTAIHNWVQKVDLQSTSEAEPNHIAVDETVIQFNDEGRWLYAAVDTQPNNILHLRLVPTRRTQLPVHFLRELTRKVPVIQATILFDDAHYLKATVG